LFPDITGMKMCATVFPISAPRVFGIMTGMRHCTHLLVEMGSWRVFARLALTSDPPSLSLLNS
jgi:hypothetical protein